MEHPYQPPTTLPAAPLPADDAASKRRFWKRMIGISVAALVAAPAGAFIGIVRGMNHAMSELSSTVERSNMELISSGVSMIYLVIILALTVAFPALIFLIISLIRLRRLPKPA